MTIREKIAKDKAEFILKSSDILSKQVNQAQKNYCPLFLIRYWNN